MSSSHTESWEKGHMTIWSKVGLMFKVASTFIPAILLVVVLSLTICIALLSFV